MAATNPAGYSKTQIALHWIIAVLIVFQIIAHEAIVRVWEALAKGEAAGATDALLANLHVWSGILIWVLAVWRVTLRLTRGAPSLPENEHPVLKFIAHATHVILYALILLMPVSGGVAWFLGVEDAAWAHSTAKFVLLPLVLLHVAGALAHRFIFKSGVMERMIRP